MQGRPRGGGARQPAIAQRSVPKGWIAEGRSRGGSTDIVGIDIGEAKFDAALLVGKRTRHAAFSNTEAGFEQFLAWLARHQPASATPLHACVGETLVSPEEATGNWGLDLAAFLHGRGVRVSVVNPARIKAFGESELSRNKTDALDAALIARFCRAHDPGARAPPAAHLRELPELVRRCDALEATRVQEMNRKAPRHRPSAMPPCGTDRFAMASPRPLWRTPSRPMSSGWTRGSRR